MPSDQELIEHLQDVADELGRAPSTREFAELQDRFTMHDYIDAFGSWLLAREEADLEFIRTEETNDEGKVKRLSESHRKIPEEELIEELRRVFEDHEGPAAEDYFDEHGKYHSQTIWNRFGSWGEGVKKAGVGPTKRETVWVKEDNYNWGGGVDVEYGEDWKETRNNILQRDDYECQICGTTRDEHLEKYGRSLDVHHIVPKRKFENDDEANDPENLVTLCRKCHRKWEGVPVLPVEPSPE